MSVCKQLYKCMKESSEDQRIIYCSREKRKGHKGSPVSGFRNPELNGAETEGKQRGEEVVFAGFTGKHES